MAKVEHTQLRIAPIDDSVSITQGDGVRVMRVVSSSDFPDELLFIIKSASMDHDSTDPVRDLGIITWVCRRWRAVALDNPLLWTHIHMTSYLNLVDLFLQRSKGLLLSIFVSKRGPSTQEMFICRIFCHASRIQEIRIADVEEWHDRAYLAPPLTQAATATPPALCKLHINNGIPILDPTVRIFSKSCTLQTCAFAWAIPWLSINLVELSIVNENPASSYVLPPPQWLEVLSRIPSLQLLRLDGSICVVRGVNTYPEQDVVRLEKLETLNLVGEGFKCQWLIEHIDCPVATDISVRMRSAKHFPQTTKLVCRKDYGNASRGVVGVNAPPLRLLSIQCGRPLGRGWDRYFFGITGWEERLRDWCGPAGAHDVHSNVFIATSAQIAFLKDLANLFRIVENNVPLQDVHTLALSMRPGREHEDDYRILNTHLLPFVRSLPSLIRLELYGWPEHAPIQLAVVGDAELGNAAQLNISYHLVNIVRETEDIA